jgi:hypothetical protein
MGERKPSQIDELLTRPKITKETKQTEKRIKQQLTLLDIKKQFIVQKQEDHRARKKPLRVELEPCSSRCKREHNYGKDCSPDNCTKLEAKFGKMAVRALEKASNISPQDQLPKKPKGANGFERSQLYNGTIIPWRHSEGGESEIPVYDSIVGDREIWALPELIGGLLMVSHRVTIFGIRSERKSILTIVEVYVKSWKQKHFRCDRHKKKLKREMKYVCPECHHIAKKPQFRNSLVDGVMSFHCVGYMCIPCEHIVRHKTPVYSYTHICPACLNLERARNIAWDWFSIKKLRACGVNYIFLPFEKYAFYVQELSKKNSVAKGKEWH